MDLNELKETIRKIIKEQLRSNYPQPAAPKPANPNTRPEPTTIPITRPKIRPNPLAPPKEAPKPKPKYKLGEATPKAVHDKALNREKNRVQTSQRAFKGLQAQRPYFDNIKDKNHLTDLIYKGTDVEQQQAKSGKMNESEKEAFKNLMRRWKNLKK